MTELILFFVNNTLERIQKFKGDSPPSDVLTEDYMSRVFDPENGFAGRLLKACSRRWHNAGLMLSQRHRRWFNIKPTLGQNHDIICNVKPQVYEYCIYIETDVLTEFVTTLPQCGLFFTVTHIIIVEHIMTSLLFLWRCVHICPTDIFIILWVLGGQHRSWLFAT